uniref:Cysteine-rich with EGF-like domains 1 n=1 Tax=Nothobranchius rachovii TaxID=451742 RepID=A0A1A8NUA4_9TELE
MGTKWLPRNVLFLSLLAVRAHSCPDACSKCSKPDNCEFCRPGWILHNNTCVDIDECGTKLGKCSQNSYCLNTEGSFLCKACDVSCVGCLGSGPARCRKCAPGYRLMGSKCVDVDECSDRVLACHGLDEICFNTEGSFRCGCAEGFTRQNGVCVKKQLPSVQEKGLFEDLQDDEVEVLQQMFFGVVLCALATLAAKGDLVYTSMFIGAVAAMAGYWLSERGDRLMNNFFKQR